MKTLISFCLILFCSIGFAQDQDDILAREYFKNGEFEKAMLSYEQLLKQKPYHINYITQLVKTYQQLEKYDEVENLLLGKIEKIKYPSFYVELGYNHQLKNEAEKANEYYQKAIASLDENASFVYSVGQGFVNRSLLDQAIVTYEKGMRLNPKFNFSMQLAQIYGEQGNIEKMFTSFMEFAQFNPSYINNIKRAISDFISEDGLNDNNAILRKILLKKIQQEPDLLWNEMLSWLFIQQKDFNKSFLQEKAIFNRQPESLDRIEELANIALNESETDVAKQIFTYIINTAQDIDTILDAHYHLLQIETQLAFPETFNEIENKYLALFEQYGRFPQTLKLQIAYAHFLAFYNNQTNKATNFLKEALELQLTSFQEAEVKLELGDILVLQEKFNEALIYYTQIQRKLKNSTISQQARFKVAKTSYYKGDFKWAESQLKILKASTSQLIANDALDLKLLISDNKYEDSTQTALKLYAKADLLAFQNRDKEAIVLLDKILENHKTETIVDQALFMQAKLFEKEKNYTKAQENYQRIIDDFKEDILADDAFYYLAELNNNYLAQPEKAKNYYEQIIFNYEDSIYFVEARKKYRALRGDAIN